MVQRFSMHPLVERRYNNNIDLIHVGQRPLLEDDEWYALMVTSRKGYKDPRTFFDEAEGWLGLEQTSSNRIYISKDTYHCDNPARGLAFVVRVKNPGLCYDLTRPVERVVKHAPKHRRSSGAGKRSSPGTIKGLREGGN